MTPPTMKQRQALAAYNENQFGMQQATLSLRDVMDAAERSAHLSRGYTPEHPAEAQELRPLHLLIVALVIAFGVGAWATYLYFLLGIGQ